MLSSVIFHILETSVGKQYKRMNYIYMCAHSIRDRCPWISLCYFLRTEYSFDAPDPEDVVRDDDAE